MAILPRLSTAGFLCLLLSAFPLLANADFEAANKLYVQGQYAAAIGAYQKMLTNGQTSAALYFNLGNAHFKASQLGHAIAAYRQAEQLAPRDPDIRANLQFARRTVNEKETAGPPWWLRLLQRLSLDEWTLLTAGGLWLWLGLLAAGQWRTAWRPSLRPAVYAALALMLAAAACLGLVAYELRGKTTAIVVVRDAQARMSPYDEVRSGVPLPDGTELVVTGAKNDWLEIRDPKQRTGWVKQSQVVLFPPR